MHKILKLVTFLLVSACATTPRSPLSDPLPGQPAEWTQNFKEMSDKAAQKNRDAMIDLCEFYLFGPEPFQNHQEAYQMLSKLVQVGDAEAMELLAGMYLNGRGVDQDGKKAFELYERGAFLGHGACQFNAGAIALEGEGGAPQNPNKAYYWLSKATLNPDLDAMRYDAAHLRNEAGALLSQEKRMEIIQTIYTH